MIRILILLNFIFFNELVKNLCHIAIIMRDCLIFFVYIYKNWYSHIYNQKNEKIDINLLLLLFFFSPQITLNIINIVIFEKKLTIR